MEMMLRTKATTASPPSGTEPSVSATGPGAIPLSLAIDLPGNAA